MHKDMLYKIYPKTDPFQKTLPRHRPPKDQRTKGPKAGIEEQDKNI
jgi:hypothetical protein